MIDSNEVGLDALHALQRLGQGHLIDEVYAALQATCDDVAATGRKGTVTVTLAVQRAVANGDPRLIVVHEEVKRTPPKGEAKGALFYAQDSQLFVNDPKAPSLPTFRVVDTPEGTQLRDPGAPDQNYREVENS